ncbi:Alcohol dehydrogenase zinc-binding domain protein [Methylocella silvestris BL2]|uniref:Alcohol dehydrogenase zinc-binding domain protein n=1 Tax=Methylocella silvestris (strain DSM 15510 / CIP 108128 / LMG 27833 / NCIMB 13906 / BL2) TaxID=395965 RepID=B8EMP3_METSB|nr:quinone oxidoreductase [Methylocella silvestris]ACK52722.1 Alcohol dehydrogenase zinc-binding domain protein [Methylocella silvestris BL2]
MVKAVRVHETGGPEVMRIEDIEIPPPGRGEVVMRNHACGVNFIDVYYREGRYKAQLPFTLGDESAGEVVAVGKGVKSVKAGDRVAALSTFGGYAEARLVNADRLIKLPKSISYETAAAMLLKGLTAQYLLRQTFKVKKGHRVLIHAAAGGVGLILCQWAKALGAQVIGTVGTLEKAALAKKAGAKHVILYRNEDFAARVKEITKDELCDVVYDGVGKATFPASLDCLRPRGLFVSFGSSSGPVDAFDIGLLASRGSLYATRPSLNTYAASSEALNKMAADLIDIVSSGKVEIALGGAFPLEEAANLHRALENRETTGSLVLIP